LDFNSDSLRIGLGCHPDTHPGGGAIVTVEVDFGHTGDGQQFLSQALGRHGTLSFTLLAGFAATSSTAPRRLRQSGLLGSRRQ
jgi:hypothetical protein